MRSHAGLTSVYTDTVGADVETVDGRAASQSRLGRMTRAQPLGAVGAVILLTMVVIAVAAPVVAPFDPTLGDPAALYAPPGPPYWLGTDAFGRDIASRLIYGARVSLLIGLGTSLLGVAVGAALGTVAAYRGQWTDSIIQRAMDALLAFPMLLLALAMATMLGPSIENVIVSLAVPIVPRAARVVRSSVLVLRSTPFVEASRAIGCGDMRIIVRHIVPNTLAPLLVIATAYLGLAIVQEAALDYLGAGIQEPQASWGLMLSGSATSLALTAPWIVIFPGLAICLAVLAANLVGDAIRDLLDPRLRRDY